MNIKFLSFTQIDMYLQCPKKYEWKYIKKPKVKTGSIPLYVGSAAHSAIATILQAKKNGGRVNTAAVLNSIRPKFLQQVQSLSDNPIALLKELENIIYAWHKAVYADINPTAIELELKPKILGVPFLMYIDAIHDGKLLIDWKVGGKSKSQHDVDHSLQLSLYAHATNISDVAFGSIARNKVPLVKLIRGKRTKPQIDWALEVVSGAIDGIKRDYFPTCSPEHFLCNIEYCDFYALCRGKAEGIYIDEKPPYVEPYWLKPIQFMNELEFATMISNKGDQVHANVE